MVLLLFPVSETLRVLNGKYYTREPSSGLLVSLFMEGLGAEFIMAGYDKLFLITIFIFTFYNVFFLLF